MGTLEQIIHIMEQTDNVFVTKKLKEIKDTIQKESNDMILGGKIRKLLSLD